MLIRYYFAALINALLFILYSLVIKFIYFGSTTVAAADVDEFMNAAEKTFGLRGLQQRQDDQDQDREVWVKFSTSHLLSFAAQLVYFGCRGAGNKDGNVELVRSCCMCSSMNL